MTKLILIGGGGHCRSCIEAANSSGEFEIVAILDRPEKVGEKVMGVQVAGTDEDLARFVAEGVSFLVTIGQTNSAAVRIAAYERILAAGGKAETVRAKTAILSDFAEIGDGTALLHRTLVNAGATVGANCIINTGALIEHDAIVEDHVHVSTGAIVNGGCRVGRGSLIGSNSVLLHGVSVCAAAMVGAGAVVTRDITEPGVYVGTPARRVR